MSAGVTVPVNFKVGGDLSGALARITAQSNALGKSIAGIGDAGKLKSFGLALQDQAEALHALRSGVDDTVERLNLFGDAGAALAGEINKISDPMKRLELGQLALSGQTSKLGTAISGVSQRFAEMKTRAAIALGGVENLELVMGAAGIAAGTLAAAIGGTLAAAYDRATNGLEKYLEKNKQAKALQDFAAQAADANAQELGKSVSKLSSDFELAQAASTSFFDKYLTSASKILQNQSTYSKEFQALWGVQAPALLGPALDLVGDLGRGFADATLHIDKLGKVFGSLATPLKNTFNATQTLTQTFNGQQVAVNQLTLSLQTYGAQLDEVARKASSATPYLDALTGGRGSQEAGGTAVAPFARGGGGGGRPDDRRQRFGAALAGGVGTAAGRGQEGSEAAQGLGGVAAGAAGRSGLGGVAGAGALGGQGGGAGADLQTAQLAQGVTQGKLLASILNDGKSAAQGLAGSLADVAAGLASGSLKAGDFGAAIKGAFGGIFKDLGRGFVLQGTALLFTPGGQAAGAGMIGAGLALSVLGGAMSRGGGGSSSPPGGGGGSAAAGAVSAAARQAAGATPQEARGPSTVILRVGERELQGTLVELTQDGQARGMGRRMRR